MAGRSVSHRLPSPPHAPTTLRASSSVITPTLWHSGMRRPVRRLVRSPDGGRSGPRAGAGSPRPCRRGARAEPLVDRVRGPRLGVVVPLRGIATQRPQRLYLVLGLHTLRG